MGDLEKITNTFLAEDIVKNNSENRKEEIKSVKMQNKKIEVDNCDETHEDSEEESEEDYSFHEEIDGDNTSSCYGISED